MLLSSVLALPASMSLFASALLLLLLGGRLTAVAGGSCREAQLCCNGRDSSCVVQKAPINAIIEDLSDKPCYCDHACLKLGDCCDDFKDHCGVLDCQVSDWAQWSECDKSCGTGMMTRTRKVLQAAQNGGKHCPSLVQKRGCQGYRCHGHHDKKILHEMALLLPGALSHNRHANDSSDIRRNLRLRYRDSYKHNREHEYCVEFEVIKASKACHKLPPYNLMLEGDRITVRCDLEALIQDSNVATTTTTTTTTTTSADAKKHNSRSGNAKKYQKFQKNADETAETDDEQYAASDDADNNNNNNNNDDDEENMLDTGSDESIDYDSYAHQSHHHQHDQQQQQQYSHGDSATTTTTTTTTPPPPISYHCRGEGLAGRTTRWSALPAPSCRGKWLRLTVGPPKKCQHAQFIFV